MSRRWLTVVFTLSHSLPMQGFSQSCLQVVSQESPKKPCWHVHVCWPPSTSVHVPLFIQTLDSVAFSNNSSSKVSQPEVVLQLPSRISKGGLYGSELLLLPSHISSSEHLEEIHHCHSQGSKSQICYPSSSLPSPQSLSLSQR